LRSTWSYARYGTLSRFVACDHLKR